MAVRLTLQNRITTITIISTVIFISIFVVIQLNNQLTNLIQYNSYQAKLSSVITKNNLESVLTQIELKDASKYLQETLLNLSQVNVIKDVLIFDREGRIIACTDQSLVGSTATYRELLYIEEILKSQREDKKFFSFIDKSKRRIDIYFRLLDTENFCRASFSLGNIKEALLGVYRPAITACIIFILANIFLGYLISKMVVGPIRILNQVTKIIAGGNLDVRTNIETNDELQELGETFNYMTSELIKMKEKAENANPLTKLPGNIVIREEVEKRIAERRKFAVIHTDLDNFKAYNDKYGLSRGDEVIKLTADILREAIRLKGNPDDLLGHEGGDDFVLITTPERGEDLTNYIISEFDSRIRSLYIDEDLKQGYIISISRQGEIIKFPIMSISLAGVSNQTREISSYTEITNIAAEVKKRAKSILGSVFVMDKRKA